MDRSEKGVVVLPEEQLAPLYNGVGRHDENGVGRHDDEPTSEDGAYVSEERYWEEYYDRGDFAYEWNDGRLEVKPVGDYAQFQVYVWFLNLVKDFLHVNPIARMIGQEMGFRLKLPRKTTIRKPDLAIVLDVNRVALRNKDRSYKGIFDICIESISDSTKKEVERDTITKKYEYEAVGVQEYYILDERGKETQFYRRNTQGVYVPIRPVNGVIQSRVLPSFQFRRADLYTLPQPPQMIEDEVYRSFTSPFVRAERRLTEIERQRANQEKIRADYYASLLKAAGIMVDDPFAGETPNS